jgi:hypothetical protein
VLIDSCEEKKKKKKIEMTIFIVFNDLVSEQYSLLLMSIVVSTIHSPKFIGYNSEAAGSCFCLFSSNYLTKIVFFLKTLFIALECSN